MKMTFLLPIGSTWVQNERGYCRSSCYEEKPLSIFENASFFDRNSSWMKCLKQSFSWNNSSSYHLHHANENDFTYVNSLLYTNSFVGPLPSCFSFTSFLSGTHQKLPCGKWFKIPLPLFPFNYLTILHSGIEWDCW